MGTTVVLQMPPRSSAEGTVAVQALFEQWEQTLSRFRPTSELSFLNSRAGTSVMTSALLFNVVAAALEAARATDGLFDPTMLMQIQQLGYDRSFISLSSSAPAAPSAPIAGGGWRQVRLDARTHRITLPAHVGIDLGGIAKGMAVDAAIDHLRTLGASIAAVSAGGDLAVLGIPPALESWPIEVAAPDGGQIVPLHHGAIATSGIGYRHWQQGGDKRHHLLDPRTGSSSTNSLWSVSVAAGRCMHAEVAAKAAFILGPSAGADFLQTRRLAGLMIDTAGRATAVAAWPTAAERSTSS